MTAFKSLKNRKTPMRRKLFFYMLALAVIVLSFLLCGLFFFGHFSSAKQTAANDLSFQMKTFDRQVSKYFEDMTRMSNSLSVSVAKITDEYLAGEGIALRDLNDDRDRISELQRRLFDKLGTELLKTDCSGGFLMLNATVNSHLIGAESSATGLYFQRSSLDETDETLLLFRGISAIGREKGVMPHRQWRLEFNVDEIPDYDRFLERASRRDKSPLLTGISVVHGTSERTMNFIMPVFGKNDELYGLCGFEISEFYFKQCFSQPSQLEHLTCMIFPKTETVLDTNDGFSTGVYDGYYLPPHGSLTVKEIGGNVPLVSLDGNDSSYIAKIQPTTICGDEYLLVAAYPKDEYNQAVTNSTISIVLLILLLVGTTFAVCVFFSRRFLSPLLKGLEQIQKHEHKTAESQFTEIDLLFAFLAEQDRQREEEAAKLRDRCDEQGNLLEQTQADIDRLAYLRKNEVSPDDYEMFKMGLKTLTKTEKQIFNYYLDGKSAEEIMTLCNIQKSTLKYHNHNILSKLGVSSRKQMLRYATLLKQEATRPS